MSSEHELSRAKQALATGRPSDAVAILTGLARTHPSREVLLGLGQALDAAGDKIAALGAREQALEFPGTTAGDLYHLAKAQEQALRHDAARKTFNKLLTIAPHVPEVAWEAARLARVAGDFDSAATMLAPALEKHPDHPRLLAERVLAGSLDQETVEHAERIASAQHIDQSSRLVLAFALADHWDREKDSGKAWHWAEQGNTLYSDQGRTLGEERSAIDQALSLFGNLQPNPRKDGPQLIYLTGPPRSGGSLLQQILAAPTGHQSLGERGAHLPFLFEVCAQGQDPWQRDARRTQDGDLLGINRLAPEARVIIDKTPHNAHVVGLISRLHPGAVFIDQRRRLKDTLISIYLNGFSNTFGYARRVETIAEYLVLQRETMLRWKDAGLSLLSHNHERFIRSPKDEGSKLFKELGWAWSDDVLDTKNRSRDIKTFSARSARGEVSEEYSGRWERYADFVPELPEAFLALAEADEATV